ncbi:MAG: hypothetical protein DMG07_00055 [Acidobacteria bacterium]|nr:MAG: hypothetical protein DMG07_00055 [Acidobacteriota bacterium]
MSEGTASPRRFELLWVWMACASLVLAGCAHDGPPPARSGSSGAGEVRFAENLIMDNYAYAYGICAADLDGDGDLDLTSADYTPHNNLYWFENDGKGRFVRHFIQRADPQRLERHMVGDVNRDGHPDVVIVKNQFGNLLWFENSGTPADGALWRRHVITRDLPGAYDVVLADLDGDGDLDVAASSWRFGNQVAWFENRGTPCSQQSAKLCYEEGEWPKHMIDDNIKEPQTIRAADFDGDGDLDLLATGTGEGLVVWYENSGKPSVEAWKKHVIDPSSPRPCHGQPVDMDGDGDIDVVMALGMGVGSASDPQVVVWYENSGAPRNVPWKKHVIGQISQSAFEAVAGDLDGDGDVDVVATDWGTDGGVVWFENPGDPRGIWIAHELKKHWPRANQVIVADLDKDGRLDIAAVAEHGSNQFIWWRNLGRIGR